MEPPNYGAILARSEMRVLVVEDAPVLLTLIRRFLAEAGYTVGLAENLHGARLALRDDGPFDVVICDYELPDGVAPELLPTLPPMCQFITLSGYQDIERDPAYPCWIGHWEKPFPPERILQALDQLHARRAAEHGARPSGAAESATLERAQLPLIVPLVLRESARLLGRGEISESRFELNLERLRKEELEPRGLQLHATLNGIRHVQFVIENHHGVHLTLDCGSNATERGRPAEAV